MIKPSLPQGTRRAFLGGVFASVAVTAAPYYANAAGFLRGGGDIRRVNLRSARTSEAVDTIYWVEGKYIKEALAEINWFMRDWRQNEVIRYDARNIDIMAATLRLMDTDEAYNVVSGYRSPATNRMISRTNRGVAQNSYHMKGMAADLKLKSRSIHTMAKAALACNAGGVGKYGRSNFVHMDCGPVRTWRG
ncbi:YcbK family protein [Halovulum sp. GXIMD14793]